jgi:5-carboxymethyl-2-hydroxymuconate isomerase
MFLCLEQIVDFLRSHALNLDAYSLAQNGLSEAFVEEFRTHVPLAAGRGSSLVDHLSSKLAVLLEKRRIVDVFLDDGWYVKYSSANAENFAL